MNWGIPEIRPARAEDATAVTEGVAAVYRHYIARIGKPPGPMLDDYAEVIRQRQVFVLANEARVIGVLVLIRQEREVLLDNVAVHPDYQGCKSQHLI
jgi:N-acetylglutamate synthase-like GNAT family acetyltransferase